MYNLPKFEQLSFLTEKEVLQIQLNLNSITVIMNDDISITIENPFQINGTFINIGEVSNYGKIANILGSKIAAYEITDNELKIYFTHNNMLTLYAEASNYECFTIDTPKESIAI